MKIIIIYESKYYGNTKKLCEGIANKNDNIFSFDIVNNYNDFINEIDKYDLFIFASGIAFGNYYKNIRNFIKNFKTNKKVFLIWTSGNSKQNYSKKIKKLLSKNNIEVVGSYNCKGFEDIGPLKLFGGINKGFPNDKNIDEAYDKVKNFLV